MTVILHTGHSVQTKQKPTRQTRHGLALLTASCVGKANFAQASATALLERRFRQRSILPSEKGPGSIGIQEMLMYSRLLNSASGTRNLVWTNQNRPKTVRAESPDNCGPIIGAFTASFGSKPDQNQLRKPAPDTGSTIAR